MNCSLLSWSLILSQIDGDTQFVDSNFKLYTPSAIQVSQLQEFEHIDDDTSQLTEEERGLRLSQKLALELQAREDRKLAKASAKQQYVNIVIN